MSTLAAGGTIVAVLSTPRVSDNTREIAATRGCIALFGFIPAWRRGHPSPQDGGSRRDRFHFGPVVPEGAGAPDAAVIEPHPIIVPGERLIVDGRKRDSDLACLHVDTGYEGLGVMGKP